MIYTNRFIFIDKVINQILSRKNIIWSKFSPKKACQLFYGKRCVTAQEFSNKLKSITGDYAICRPSDCFDGDIEAIMNQANQVLAHTFDLLGFGMTKVDPIDWHTDFIHKYSWNEQKFYRKYELISKEGGRDIKVVWDFNRCHHFLWLGEAFLISQDTRYAKEIVIEIDNWIDNNPLMYSVAWTCSMDVAIRAVNWIYSLSMIESSGFISDDFANKVSIALYQHLFFIINNLEKTIPYSGNHYLSDLAGLLFLSSLFPDNRLARFCYKFALKEFYREARKELNQDGSNYENSVSYHRLVTELFVYTYLTLVRQGKKIPEDIPLRIKNACEYIGHYTKTSGLSPLIGDNDNGRFLPFVPRDYRDHRYLKAVGDCIFSSNSKSLFGDVIFANPTKNIIANAPLSTNLFESGLGILKQGVAKLYVTNGNYSFRGGLNPGAVYGTHTHCDNLSFELCLGKNDIFVDPGCYVYTSEPNMRNRLRSAESHNTLMVDGQNFADFPPASVFLMKQRLIGLSLRVKGDENRIDGHFLFDNGTLQYACSRRFYLTESSLNVCDSVKAHGAHSVELHFIVAPGIDVTGDGREYILSLGDYAVTLNVENCSSSKIEEYPYSPSYGTLQKCQRITFYQTMIDNINIISKIQWERKE